MSAKNHTAKDQTAKSHTAQSHADRHCQHTNSRGHRCRMLIDNAHSNSNGWKEENPKLCAYHLRKTSSAHPSDEAVAAELLGGIENFSSAASVNLFLGNLLKQVARRRIPRRDAVALAYISQLLLNSLPALERESEAEQDAAAGQFLINDIVRSRHARLAEQQSKETASADIVPGKPS